MQRNLTFRRPVIAVVIVLVASAAIAACGGSSRSGSSAASTKSDGLKYAACMRAHGVPDYPDPGANKFGGVLDVKGSKVTVDGHALSEAWSVVRPADSKCQKYIEPAYGPRYSASELAKIRVGALAMSKCMRAHGLSDYPDLSVAPGPGGHGLEVGFGHGGLPQSEIKSPGFKADNITCSKLLNKTIPGQKG